MKKLLWSRYEQSRPCQLRLVYQKAVDEWVNAIRAEEALATPDHSMVAMEKWDDAHFREQDAQRKASEAREAYNACSP